MERMYLGFVLIYMHLQKSENISSPNSVNRVNRALWERALLWLKALFKCDSGQLDRAFFEAWNHI